MKAALRPMFGIHYTPPVECFCVVWRPPVEENLIACPHCNTRFPLTSAIEQPIVERLRAQFAADTAKKESALQTREALIARQTAEIAKEREAIHEQLQTQLEAERKKITTELEKRAR